MPASRFFHSTWYLTASFRRFTRSGFTLGLYVVALRCGFTPWFYAVAEGVGSVFAPAPASKCRKWYKKAAPKAATEANKA